MIVGIGTDIVNTARIGEVLQNFGERFARRVLCDNEMAKFHAHGDSVRYLAKRFAAKEAVAKALGTGIGEIGWHDIEVVNNELGAPAVAPSEALQRYMKSHGISRFHLSISDEQQFSVAFAVAES